MAQFSEDTTGARRGDGIRQNQRGWQGAEAARACRLPLLCEAAPRGLRQHSSLPGSTRPSFLRTLACRHWPARTRAASACQLRDSGHPGCEKDAGNDALGDERTPAPKPLEARQSCPSRELTDGLFLPRTWESPLCLRFPQPDPGWAFSSDCFPAPPCLNMQPPLSSLQSAQQTPQQPAADESQKPSQQMPEASVSFCSLDLAPLIVEGPLFNNSKKKKSL